MSSRQTNGKPLSRSDPGAKVSQIAPALIDYYFVVSLVLGGCCSNVLAYERLLKINPNIGSALTFSQMLFITAQTLPSFLSWSDSSFIPQLKPRQVPLSQWALQVLVNTSSSLLNNWAFAFNVPFTLQIVFRSAGLAVSMLFGRFFLNRRYSLLQVASALISLPFKA
jgi:UDP-xylose/UDP-N-acetylglucosamine transporter B4